jgi:2-polyprenyl-3-methyl-5-hydroxy-6-metoxy-1,4-benzoquinol methylase
MKVARAGNDQAGQDYWNRSWDAKPLPPLWRVDSDAIGAYVDRSLFSSMSESLKRYELVGPGKILIEAGCARSGVLPHFAKKLGLRLAGIDYSPNGCQQTRMMLEREEVQGEIYCCDVFSPPDNLVEQFDVLVSFGLIEHFSDTTTIVTALSRLVRPGGLIFTNVPNMYGVTGFVQRMMDRKIYDIHVPLSVEAVRNAHLQSDLNVLACDYFLSTNFGVVNLNSIRIHSLEWWMKKLVVAVLVRVSMATWWWERTFGPLPTSRVFSPYVNCLAAKPR